MMRVSLSALSVLFLVFVSDGYAETFVAASSGNWNDPQTWSPMGIPGPGDSVQFGVVDGVPVQIDLNSDVEITALSILGTADVPAILDMNGFALNCERLNLGSNLSLTFSALAEIINQGIVTTDFLDIRGGSHFSFGSNDQAFQKVLLLGAQSTVEFHPNTSTMNLQLYPGTSATTASSQTIAMGGSVSLIGASSCLVLGADLEGLELIALSGTADTPSKLDAQGFNISSNRFHFGTDSGTVNSGLAEILNQNIIDINQLQVRGASQFKFGPLDPPVEKVTIVGEDSTVNFHPNSVTDSLTLIAAQNSTTSESNISAGGTLNIVGSSRLSLNANLTAASVTVAGNSTIDSQGNSIYCELLEIGISGPNQSESAVLNSDNITCNSLCISNQSIMPTYSSLSAESVTTRNPSGIELTTGISRIGEFQATASGQPFELRHIAGILSPLEDQIDIVGSYIIDGGNIEIEYLGSGDGEFDRIHVMGDLNINTACLTTLLKPGLEIGPGEESVVIQVDGTRAGIFDGLPEGSVIYKNGNFDLMISYVGGDGNDIAFYTRGTYSQPIEKPLFPTGVDTVGSLLEPGEEDPNYLVLETKQNAVVIDGIPNSWVANNSNSQWIWENSDGTPTNVVRTFRTTVDLSEFVPETVSISGLWAADNCGLDILINGQSTGNTSPGFQFLVPFDIHTGFVPGLNQIDFVVEDVGAIAGFRVDSMNATGRAVPDLSSSDPAVGRLIPGSLAEQIAQVNSGPPLSGFGPVNRKTDFHMNSNFDCTAGIGGILRVDSNSMNLLDTPPSSVLDGELENNSRINVFTENTQFVLSEDVLVDATDSGIYDGSKTLNELLSAGPTISTHLLHFDTNGSTIVLNGTIVFESDVLGVIVDGNKLIASDDDDNSNGPFLGAAGTEYPDDSRRAWEIAGDDGMFQISADLRSVTVEGRVGNFLDHMRVITAASPADPLEQSFLSPDEFIDGVDEVTFNNCSSAWYRFSFELPANFSSPFISGIANVDDVAVAYLNGNQISASVLPDDLGKDRVDELGRPLLSWPTTDEFVTADETYFVPGTNELVFGVVGDLSSFDPTGIEFAATVSVYENGGIVGDVNQDGIVNLLDVQPFIDRLVNNEYQFEADINGDGTVNLLDVDPFISLLGG